MSKDHTSRTRHFCYLKSIMMSLIRYSCNSTFLQLGLILTSVKKKILIVIQIVYLEIPTIHLPFHKNSSLYSMNNASKFWFFLGFLFRHPHFSCEGRRQPVPHFQGDRICLNITELIFGVQQSSVKIQFQQHENMKQTNSRKRSIAWTSKISISDYF